MSEQEENEKGNGFEENVTLRCLLMIRQELKGNNST
jgi:hypothetical protein